MLRALKVDAKDNVAVVAQAVAAGDQVQVGDATFVAANDIPIGHKIALCDIPAGAMVVKYGATIGIANVDIKTGDHVHTQNMLDITTQLCQEYAAEFKKKVGAAL